MTITNNDIFEKIERVQSLRYAVEHLIEELKHMQIDLHDAETCLRDAATIDSDTTDEQEQDERDTALSCADDVLNDLVSDIGVMRLIDRRTADEWIELAKPII